MRYWTHSSLVYVIRATSQRWLRSLSLAWLLCLLCVGLAAAMLPLQAEPSNDPTPLVNPKDRQAAVNFYHDFYRPGESPPAQWSGNPTICTPGMTSEDFRAAVLSRINYYRGMAGLQPVTFADESNRKAQAAALITVLNGLSHKPPPTARCYTASAAQGAVNSHLYLGRFGPAAIDGYIQDHDETVNHNYHVGHRRWIFYPQLQEMGTGDIPGTESIPPANALWVVDGNLRGPRPVTREPFVAWPPPGFVPYPVVYPRWSFAYPGADFAQAVVHMAQDGVEIPVRQEDLYEWKPTEPTLVWVPLGLESRDAWPRPAADTVFTVTISNIFVADRWLSFSYNVTVFDPAQAVAEVRPTATPTPRPLLQFFTSDEE